MAKTHQPLDLCRIMNYVHRTLALLKTVVAVGFLILVGPAPAEAVENALLTKLFSQYEAATHQFIQHLAERQWGPAMGTAVRLTAKSAQLREMGKSAENNTWEYYASNLHHHCKELQDVLDEKDGVEGIYLAAILISHIGQIQSSNPRWLLEHVRDNIELIKAGLKTRNRNQVRDAAEIVHTAANKILLSAYSAPQVYRHTRWTSNINALNGLGDVILGAVNRGEWDALSEKLEKIQVLFSRWEASFRPVQETER